MKRFLTVPLIIALLLIALFGLPLVIDIWLPDVFISSRHTLAFQQLASGHLFRVIQYWNHGDFYNTELIHTFPNGSVETHILDADDGKTWRVPLLVDEAQKTATIILGGNRIRKVTWE